MAQTPGQLARHLQASMRVDNKAKLIPSLLAQEPGARTALTSPYSGEDHLQEVQKEKNKTTHTHTHTYKFKQHVDHSKGSAHVFSYGKQ